MDMENEYQKTPKDEELVSYVVSHTDQWRDWRDSNYLQLWKEYERLWRGLWDPADKMRDSERSRIVTPALQQAIETRHAEIMEAIFGNGEFFDIKDDVEDQNGRVDVEVLRAKLSEDFKKDKVRKAVDQIELLAEVYGTGIGEILVATETEFVPVTTDQQVAPGQFVTGIEERDRFAVRLSPVNPKNFLIDPNATSIEDALGAAVEKFVSLHSVVQNMEKGVYRQCDVGSDAPDDNLEPTQEANQYQEDKVRLLTYYGLVPRALLLQDEEEVVDLFGNDGNRTSTAYEDLVEAIVVVANGTHLLKAEESPYMMRDRPLVAYQDDTVPNRFHGRGTAEKGYNMQKAIDAQWRAHLDSLALTSAPMVAMDSTRMPRGAKFEVKPGKSFLTNGNPSEIVFPFKFGETDPNNIAAAGEFERMMLQATGTVDSAGMPSNVPRDVQSGGMSMALAGIIKKYKRTLTNFQEDFLIPFVTKAAWRYMQFSPERYPMVDMKFMPTGGLGIMAREYEQSQMVALMQTLGPQSPIVPKLLQAVVQHSGLQDREQLAMALEEMSKPDPAQAQQAQEMHELQKQLLQAQIDEYRSRAAKNMAQAQHEQVDAQLAPLETQANLVGAASRNIGQDPADKAFQQRLELADRILAEEDIQSNERIAMAQMEARNNQKSKD